MRLDIPGGPPDLLAPLPPLDAVGVRGKRSTKIRQRLISVLYTVLQVSAYSLQPGGAQPASFPEAGLLHLSMPDVIYGPIFSIHHVLGFSAWAR